MIRRAPVRRIEEAAQLDFDGTDLTYLIKRSSARRTLAMQVGEDGGVVVNAPWQLGRA